MSKLIDVSHNIEEGMTTYQGLPGPVITDFLSREASRKTYAPGTEFHIGRIEMIANTGTYVDSPFHRYADGGDLSELPLDSLANLEGLVVRAVKRQERALHPAIFPFDSIRGKALIIHTGWDAHWRTEHYSSGNHPFVTEESAALMVSAGIKLVGIDSYNIDDTSQGTRPAHTLLLRAGIPIVEHMCNLGSLPDRDFRFFAVPPPIKRFGTFAVRAFAIV